MFANCDFSKFIMLASSKLKGWAESIEGLENTIRDSNHQQDQERLEQLDKQIAEEEVKLRSKQQQLQMKKVTLLEEEESRRKDIVAITAEKSAVNEQREKLKPTIQQLKFFARIHGRHLISYFGVDYNDRGGRVYCPEGKVCVSTRQCEEECNYWNCPVVKSMNSTTPNLKPVVGAGATTTMTQLDFSTN